MRHWNCLVRARRYFGDGDRPLAVSVQPARNVLFEHRVEIGAAKTKSAQTGAPHAICRHRPRFQFGIDVERRVGKVDVGIEMLAMHARWQYFVSKRQCGFQQSGSAGRSFKVPEVRLDRTERHCVRGEMRTAEHIDHALHFDDVAHGGGCAMALDQRHSSWRQSGIFPGAFDGKFLADRVGRGNAFSLAVARSAHAAQHGVDLVFVPLSIGQTFKQEDRGAFAHDKAVRPFGIRTSAGCRERANLAELDEARGAHVAVKAAGDYHVVMVLYQSFCRGADRCHCRCAGGVTNVVGAMEVENVGNAAGNAVGQFAGHAVFRNFRKELSHPIVELARNVAADRFRQRGETGRFGQFAREFRKEHPRHGEIVLFPSDGIAQDHSRAIVVQRTLGIAVVL